jgi:preprotein translocase subunit YajC
MIFAGIFTSLILAADAPAGAPTQQDPRAGMLQMVGWMVIMVIVVFMMSGSQRKKAKQHAELLKTLKSGDKVVTSGGILGVVITVKDKSVTVRSADTKFELLKSAVAEITERAGAAAS